jgi:hypothetical protein
MTSTSNHQEDAEHVPQPPRGPQQARGPGRRRFPVKRAAATVAVSMGLAALAAGCGGGGNHTPGSSASSSRLLAQYFAYSRCMRSHGVPNFPDPSTSGGIGIDLPHSFNTSSPAYLAASQACNALAPMGHPTTGSPNKIAAEVKVARCMRSHGDPSFPDPNSQGGFDRSKFDESSPAFKTAANACKSLIAAMGPIPVAQGSS